MSEGAEDIRLINDLSDPQLLSNSFMADCTGDGHRYICGVK